MAVANILDINRAYGLARSQGEMSGDDLSCYEQMRARILDSEPEMAVFRALCDRWDNLYYPAGFTAGGASHWADHISATAPGRAHVSVNAYPSYVDIPASLISVPPVENFVAELDEQEMETGEPIEGAAEEAASARELASMAERIYVTWKDDESVEVKGHTACLVRALYGRTAAKVWYDDDAKKPVVSIIEQPRNLRYGYTSSDYRKLSWACYSYLISAEAAAEEWGLRIATNRDDNGIVYPYVAAMGDLEVRSWVDTPSELRVEVYDYWYRVPREGSEYRVGRPVQMETWNALFIGNALVYRKPRPEYGGSMPYLPLANTLVPGMAVGRSELYDIEQLIREKDERMSEAAQMMSRAINGQYWQLVGPEAPEQVSPSIRPIPNQVVGPGGGNRIEAIQPWMPTFQVETHLARIDRELADVSGLSDLLRGLAPNAVLSSGKAINALVANYEARIRMKRDLYYEWRRELWNLVATVWAEKERGIAEILGGAYRHDILPPTLTPRDDAETATLASNLVERKLWSAARGMDRVGVDDPEMEMDIIREEQTDATYNPAAVMTMAQTMTVLKQLGLQPSEEMVEAGAAGQEALAATRLLEGAPPGTPEMNAPEEQPLAAEGAGGPAPAAEPGVPVPPPLGGVEGDMLLQQQTPTGEEPRTRIVSQQRILGGG